MGYLGSSFTLKSQLYLACYVLPRDSLNLKYSEKALTSCQEEASTMFLDFLSSRTQS